MKNRKILFIGTVASSIYGFRAPLITELIKMGYEVYALVSEYSAPNELARIRNMGVSLGVYSLNRGGVNFLSDIYQTLKLFRKILSIKPDVVFSYFAKPVIFGTIAAKLAKVPNCIAMLEGLGYAFTEQPSGQPFKSKLIRGIQVILYKLSLPLADTVVFLNNDDQRDLLKKYNINVRNKFVLGGIGLDLGEYKYTPIKDNAIASFRFLFIGRLLKEKGIYDFLSAAKMVKERYPNSIFTVLGSIDMENLGSLKKNELNEYIHNGVIEYPGQVDNISEWLSKCHVFVLPSYREGMPRSTQEAMAVGRAIITTDVPGCRETVIDGFNGFLVPKWDAEKLAEKMCFFIENPTSVITMGNNSYSIAMDKFDVRKVNKKLISIIIGS